MSGVADSTRGSFSSSVATAEACVGDSGSDNSTVRRPRLIFRPGSRSTSSTDLSPVATCGASVAFTPGLYFTMRPVTGSACISEALGAESLAPTSLVAARAVVAQTGMTRHIAAVAATDLVTCLRIDRPFEPRIARRLACECSEVHRLSRHRDHAIGGPSPSSANQHQLAHRECRGRSRVQQRALRATRLTAA